MAFPKTLKHLWLRKGKIFMQGMEIVLIHWNLYAIFKIKIQKVTLKICLDPKAVMRILGKHIR